VDSDVLVRGWVIPIGIVLNPSQMLKIELQKSLLFARIVGHEFTHFLCRFSSSFELSTPERYRKSPKDSPLRKLVSKIEETFSIENHLESGLIFEIGLFGAPYSYLYTHDEILCKALESRFSNVERALPLTDYKTDFPGYPVTESNQQFGFYPAEIPLFY
jgi:hypothetical protein